MSELTRCNWQWTISNKRRVPCTLINEDPSFKPGDIGAGKEGNKQYAMGKGKGNK
jgi:hypothetical protein